MRAIKATLNLWTNVWRELHTLRVASDLHAIYFLLEDSQMVSLENEVTKQFSNKDPSKWDHEVHYAKISLVIK